MTNFIYTAVTKTGQKIQGKKEASSRESLLSFLDNQGLTVLSIREDISLGFKNILNTDIGGIPLKDKVLIAKQLATMIGAGIPIIQAMGILVDQAKDNYKEKFDQVYKKIESGLPLSKAFKSVGGLFSEVQINLIAAGEKSGKLNEMLIKVSVDLEKKKSLRGKLVGALIYPALIFVIMIIVVTVMILFMIPQLQTLYESLGKDELPFITQLLVTVSENVASPFFLVSLVVVIASIYFGYKTYVSKKERQIIVDKLRLKIPVFGDLIRKIQLTEFCRVMSMLIESGVPIIDAMSTVANSLSSPLYSEILTKSKNDVTRGSSLSLALAKNNDGAAYPEILIKIISTGEESGQIDKVLTDMYKYYDAEVEQITANLTKLLEPFIFVIVGGLVAFLAIAIYYPIYTVGNAPALS